MGGFQVSAQSFGTYQAIDWLKPSETAVHQIMATLRIRRMLEDNKGEDIIKLGIVARLFELLEVNENVTVKVLKAISFTTSFLQCLQKSEVIYTLACILAEYSPSFELVICKSLRMLSSASISSRFEKSLLDESIGALGNFKGSSESRRIEFYLLMTKIFTPTL